MSTRSSRHDRPSRSAPWPSAPTASAQPVYARRPTILRAVRGMWCGLDASGLLDPGLVAMVNRRVVTINRCEF